MISDSRKNEICNLIDNLTDQLNDEELNYAIEIMQFWKSERERQNKELEELYEKENK